MCVYMDNTSLEYFVSWMILHAWNIRCYRFRCSSFTISYTQNILRIPYIRNIPWLFRVLNILLVISSFYIKEFYFFFFYFSFITSYSLEYFGGFFFLVPLLFKIDLIVKGPSLIPCFMLFLFYNARANIFKYSTHIFLKRFLAFKIHLSFSPFKMK